MRASTFVLLALCLGVQVLDAREHDAPQCAVSGSSIEYQVTGTGGGFDVVVNPKLVTVFHLPSKLSQSFLSNQKDFSVSLMSRSVALWPLREGAAGNLNLDTDDGLHISVTLKTGPLETAKSQVVFTSEKEEQRYQAEVERRLLPLTKVEIARGLLKQFQARTASGVARTDDNVIIRVTRSVVIGDDTYVYFTVDNRGDESYRLSAVKALQGSREITPRVECEPRPEEGSFIGVTIKGSRGRGIIVLPTKDLKPGQPVEFGFIEGTRGHQLSMGVRLD